MDGWNFLESASGNVIGHAASRGTVSFELAARENCRRSSLLFLPDGRRCWFLKDNLEFETPPGGFERAASWGRGCEVLRIRAFFLVLTRAGKPGSSI